MYHRFPDASGFIEQCAHLRECYRPISLSAAVSAIRSGGPIPERAVVVTVDDGYRDFLERAFPALSSHGIPATVFLTTDLPDRKTWLWVDQVSHCVRNARVRELAASIGDPQTWKFDSDGARERAALSIKEALKKVSDQERVDWLKKLPGLLRVELPDRPPPSYAPLEWDDVRFLSTRGVEFGAHTRTHPILSRLERHEQLESEICGSKTRIEAETQARVRHFCYPNGHRADYTASAIEIVKDAGFESAVTAGQGVNHSGADVFELRRIGVEPRETLMRFARVVAGYGLKTRDNA